MSMAIVSAGVGLAVGGAQIWAGASAAKKARQAAMNRPIPQQAPSKAINDYYQMALNRAQVGAYNTAQFEEAKKGAKTGLATGINASVDRRSGNQNIGALVQGYDSALGKDAAAADAAQSGKMQQLAGATGQKSGEENMLFERNKLYPYQQKTSFDLAKMSGGNQLMNAGISNAGNSLQTAAMIGYRKQNPNATINPWSSEYVR